MDKKKLTLASIIIYGLLIFIAYYFKIGGDYFGTVSWIITFVSILISLGLGYWALKYFSFTSIQGKSVLMISLGIFSWLVADIITYLFLSENAVSAADIFFILGYPLFGVGIFYGIKTILPDFFGSVKDKFLFIFLVFVLFLGYFKFFPLAWNDNITFIENSVASAYILLDFVLLMLVFTLIWSIIKGTFSRAWMIMAIGVLFTFSGDIMYALSYDTYELAGQFMDLLYYYGYLCYGLSFLTLRWNAEKIVNKFAKKTK